MFAVTVSVAGVTFSVKLTDVGVGVGVIPVGRLAVTVKEPIASGFAVTWAAPDAVVPIGWGRNVIPGLPSGEVTA